MATGLTLTTAGAAEIEAAYQAGEVVHITSVLIGDGGGVTVPTDPDDLAAVTALFGQFGRETFDSDSSNEGVISGQIVINCRDYPGKTLREAGLVSAKGTLIAYGVYPATYLPAQSDSIIKEIILTLVLTLTHSSNVQLVIDPALATITQETGDKRYLRRALNLSDLADLGEARENLGLGNSATRNVGAEVGTVAAGDDSRINGALQKENNLSDLDDAGEALTNLGLSSNGEGFKGIVDAILYPGIIIPSEKSPAERFPWQTWESLSNTFADRVVRIGSGHGATGGSNKIKIAASNLPPHWHKSGDRSPGETWDPTTTHGTDNQKSGPLNMTAGTYSDAAGERETANDAIDVTNEYVTLCLWKRTA